MKLKVLALTAIMTAAANAITVNVGTGFGTNVGLLVSTDAGATLTAGGYYIGLGTFATQPVVTDIPSLQAAVASFQLFKSALAPTTGTTMGKIAGAFQGIDTAFNSKPFYFLIGDAATKEGSKEFAILKMGVNPLTFPANVAASTATAITLGSVDSVTTLAGTETAVDAGVGVDKIKLMTTVPETSTAILGALGALALLRRRR